MRTDERIDGRVRRGARNRAKILDAVYDLVRAGEYRPTAEMVANHAAVGDRTVFRHFEDMRQLHLDMTARVAAEILDIVTAAPAPHGALGERLSQLIRLRARVFEHIAPFRRAARVWAGTSVVPIGETRADLDAPMRAAMRSALAPEIDSIGNESIEALDALLSFETWDRLRDNQRLGKIQAARTIERATAAVLGVASDSGATRP